MYRRADRAAWSVNAEKTDMLSELLTDMPAAGNRNIHHVQPGGHRSDRRPLGFFLALALS